MQGNYYPNTDFSGTPVIRQPENVNLAFKPKGNGCANRDDDDPPGPIIGCKNISVKWKGKLQVITAGYYEFDLPERNTDDVGYVYINGNLVVTSIWGGAYSKTPVYLTAGTLHTIEVQYKQYLGDGRIVLHWKKPGSSNFTMIENKHLYPEGQEALANGSTVTETVYCVKPDIIQAIDHHLIDSFKLIPGKKIVASVWMKKDGQDCKCSTYTNNFAIRDANGVVITTFTAKERIIEGWQQFEAIFTVPENNSKITLDFKAPSDAAVFIDDLRLHPFNANMKSFVYDPVTLRLAAELDENNYASFYEYDDDGGLIRVKKETREGVKTITETRSGIQKKITDL